MPSDNLRIVGLVVARMNSSRVPGKSVLDLAGKPMLWHIINNVKRSQRITEICLATSTKEDDDVLYDIARECGIRCYRGDADLVLNRVYNAAVEFKADILVEIGGDCPFIDGKFLDSAVEYFLSERFDYLSNYDPPTFPEGFDINILTSRALTDCFVKARAPSQRIHPFSYLTRHASNYRIGNFASSQDLSTNHWSLDFPEDVAFIQAVYKKLYKPQQPISIEDILRLIADDSAVKSLNEAIEKPKVSHAFWNSPGILRDMHTDIGALAEMSLAFCTERKYHESLCCLDEITIIVDELKRANENKVKSL